MQYADEVIVVINPKPVKASNGVEDKTKGTLFKVTTIAVSQKDMVNAKDGRQYKSYGSEEIGDMKMLNEGVNPKAIKVV